MTRPDTHTEHGAELARMEVMRAALRAEKFDREHGLTLPGDSALAVVLGGFEEYLATTKQRRARAALAAARGKGTT